MRPKRDPPLIEFVFFFVFNGVSKTGLRWQDPLTPKGRSGLQTERKKKKKKKKSNGFLEERPWEGIEIFRFRLRFRLRLRF